MLEMKFSRLAPAKINLFLHILGQRPSGYHDLQTLFCLLNWGDTLHFEFTPPKEGKPPVTLLGLPEVSPNDNLIYKTYQAFHSAVSIQLPYLQVQIEKQIPMGGGLGGGSSNAATTLLALNDYLKAHSPAHQIPKEQLKKIQRLLLEKLESLKIKLLTGQIVELT